MNETIINGIDVSECRFFQRQYIEDMYESDDCNVCIDDFCTICFSECAEKDCYYKQLTRLQKENEELKEKNKELLVLANKGGALLVAESTKNKKYEQALEEIRNLAKLEGMLDENLKVFYPTNIQRILDKINEALNVENE